MQPARQIELAGYLTQEAKRVEERLAQMFTSRTLAREHPPVKSRQRLSRWQVRWSARNDDCAIPGGVAPSSTRVMNLSHF
jgi:hypothetical protein